MPKTIREYYRNAFTGEVEIEYSDDTVVKGNDAILSTDSAGNVTGLVGPDGYQTSIEAPFKVAQRLKYFYKALYAGITVAGTNITRPKNLVRIGIFGDSVGNSKPLFITRKLSESLNLAGRFFSTVYPSLGAASVANVNDGSVWTTGSYYTLPSGGEILFQDGGGRPLSTTLKLWYVKEPGAGSFKIQTRNSGGAHSDEAGYTNIDANAASVSVATITLTKTQGMWDMKAVGLAGTVKIINAAWEDATTGGICTYYFNTGGLPLATASQTPLQTKTEIYNSCSLDLCFMEFKDGSEFKAAFDAWMSFYKTQVTKPADWVFIGTTPEQVEVTAGSKDAVTNNVVMQAYANTNDHIYFDGYNPLVNWGFLTAMSWGGDGTHLDGAAHAYLASVLWRYMGFDSLMEVPTAGPFRTTGSLEIAGGSGSVQFTRDGNTAKLSLSSDVELLSPRGYLFKNSSGNNTAFVQNNGGNLHAFTSMSFGVPFTASMPTLFPSGTSGIYLSNGSANSTPTAWVGALSYKVGSSLSAAEIFSGSGSPEGSKTAPVGSVYLRTDGGAASTLYVKESGTSNTGWVAK